MRWGVLLIVPLLCAVLNGLSDSDYYPPLRSPSATQRAIAAAVDSISATRELRRLGDFVHDDSVPGAVRRSTAVELSRYWRLHREILEGQAPQRYLVGQLRNGLANRQQQVLLARVPMIDQTLGSTRPWPY